MYKHTRTQSTILPCTCSVQPLFWSYRYEARPSFHSLRRQRDKSRSAARHLLDWPEEVTCPAGTHVTTLINKRPHTHSEQTVRVNFTGCLTWEELSSSAACEEVERESSDWPRDPTLVLPFSNLPLPLLCGGDESESLATPPSSSVGIKN